MRSLVGEMVQQYAHPTIVDMEAGLEHLSRGTIRHVDTMLIIVEPYFRSMETGARMHTLGRELGIRQVYTVANKSRSPEDDRALQQFCQQRGMHLMATLPDDETIHQADRAGIAPLDYDTSGVAVSRLAELAGTLGKSSA
ncbi:hypothetical protein [Candidatus Entotheonella palauensis]|uniref:hypothetical protein n=1 Tax=Candidatus Entotheonella palauensis TaxID=93172 RepID=UPI0004B18612|nr:hypothetical protein [Candidatus Entotheonella palauensis]